VPLELQRIGSDRSSIHLEWLARRSQLPRDDEQCLIVNPAFQRASVWTIGQKRAWIESVLLDLPLPAIFINQFGAIGGGHPKYGFKDIVIDGQQRIRATAEFLAGKFKVHGERFQDQDEAFRRVFKMNVVCPVIYTRFATEVECAELYLKLLTAGTAHTDDEIERARLFVKEERESTTPRSRR
jgi:hypothetical protein